MNAQLIEKMVSEGMKSYEIAEELGVSFEAFTKFCQFKKIKISSHVAPQMSKNVSFKPVEGDEEFTDSAEVIQVMKPAPKPKKKYRERKNAITFNPDREELRRLYVDEGMTRDKLAEHYDVPRNWIDYRLGESGIRLTDEQRKGRKGVVKNRKQFVDAVKKYGSNSAVANHFGISYATARYHAQVYGVEFRPAYEKTNEEMKNLAYEFLKSDIKKLSEFAKVKGVKYQKLYQICRTERIDVVKKIQYKKRK